LRRAAEGVAARVFVGALDRRQGAAAIDSGSRALRSFAPPEVTQCRRWRRE
jgi:hypothetical protein